MVLYQNGMEIAATRVDAAVERHAAELFDRRFADQARARTAVEIDPTLFERYVGFYELDPRCIITVTREGDKLFAQLSGGPKRRLMPASEREYFYKFVAGQITFVADGDGPATALVLHQNGRDLPSLRVDAARATASEARVREINSRRAEHERPRAVDPNLYERYAGLYQRGPIPFSPSPARRPAVRAADRPAQALGVCRERPRFLLQGDRRADHLRRRRRAAGDRADPASERQRLARRTDRRRPARRRPRPQARRQAPRLARRLVRDRGPPCARRHPRGRPPRPAGDRAAEDRDAGVRRSRVRVEGRRLVRHLLTRRPGRQRRAPAA